MYTLNGYLTPFFFQGSELEISVAAPDPPSPSNAVRGDVSGWTLLDPATLTAIAANNCPDRHGQCGGTLFSAFAAKEMSEKKRRKIPINRIPGGNLDLALIHHPASGTQQVPFT